MTMKERGASKFLLVGTMIFYYIFLSVALLSTTTHAIRFTTSSECSLIVSDQTASTLQDVWTMALEKISLDGPAVSDAFIICLTPGIFKGPLKVQGNQQTRLGRRIVWRGSLEGNSIVSGGTPLTSWKQTGAVTYTANVPAGTFAEGMPARQLWVAGRRASRNIDTNPMASTGGMTVWNANDQIGFTAPHFPAQWWNASLNNLRQIELTWPLAIENWIAPRCTVSKATPTNITLASPCDIYLYWIKGAGNGANPPPPVTVEAVMPSDLTSLNPGTFYHDIDSGRIHYALAPGQTKEDLDNHAFVSGMEVLVDYKDAGQHSWENITFQYSTWLQPNTAEGFVDVQALVYRCAAGSCEPQGSVRVSNSTDISFLGCTFINLGGAYALSIGEGSKRGLVRRCAFKDISGGAIHIGNTVDASYAMPQDPRTWESSSTIEDCIMSDTASEYAGGAAVFAGYVFNLTIDHNTISNTGYTAISMGWGWGTVFPAGYGNNRITNNRMLRIMTRLRDGGGVYVNGVQSCPSVASGNYVDSDEAVYAVYYLDNGSSRWTFTSNVVSNSPLAWAFFMTNGANLPCTNSEVDHLWYWRTGDPNNACGAPKNCSVNVTTIVKVPDGGPWPPEASAIIAASGARSKWFTTDKQL